MKQKKYILALILLLYPLRHIATGLDLMDAGYALGNYRFYDTMNETWKLATYLANVVGMILTHLPFGSTWIGMNVYTGLFVGLTAAGTYLFMVNHQPENDKKELLLFISELGALSLCWAPSVILYHYLGYIFMTVATLILYTAIVKNNVRYHIIAGIILGLCVAVRMPNITYMAFILPLWYHWFTKRKEDNKWFGALVGRTLYCICGYLAGLLVPLVYIAIRYGVSAYPNMISSLFGMTETATDYKPTSMIMAMFGDYISYSVWLGLFLIYIIVGAIFFTIMDKIIKNSKNIFKIFYLLGFLVVLRFCYGRGMFGLDFADYFSMYKWVTVYLLVVIILCIWAVVSKKADSNIKLWSVFVLVTIFITPLGSNNGLYPIINNLFIVAPVSILIISEFYKKALNTINANTAFAVKSIMTCVMMCVFISGLLFGINFIFHDYSSTGSKRVSVSLKCDNAANGLLTTYDKKESLEALDSFLYENGLYEKTLITYGDIPALSYILNMEPAIFTTWADLESNSISDLTADLEYISENMSDNYPIIIIGIEMANELTDNSTSAYNKLKVIEEYILENNYNKVYENSTYMVYNTKLNIKKTLSKTE